jgi:hypothetical protein
LFDCFGTITFHRAAAYDGIGLQHQGQAREAHR